jgi:hypothetical protein
MSVEYAYRPWLDKEDVAALDRIREGSTLDRLAVVKYLIRRAEQENLRLRVTATQAPKPNP